ncbi:MAG: glycosyltransferase family 4 protein [Deferribacteres bacterium]|nr:glycosyltransferase family 4 protein [Deferribacteres bacterium]
MKIAVVGTRGFPGVQGGVETHCRQLYPRLADHDCDITVFARKPYVDSEPYTYNGVYIIPLSCPANKFLEAIVHTFKGVLKAHAMKPDILHIHAVGPSLFVPLARLLGMRVVITNHGPDYNRKKWPPPAKMFLRFCERVGVAFANEVIAISGSIAADIKSKYGRDSVVIPNGVDLPTPLDTESALRKYGLRKRGYVLAVGRFVPEKGFDDLIGAFNRLALKDMKLVIAGDADHEDRYSRALKARARSNENIVLTGFITGQPLQELYSHAGLFVLPSYHEGLPIVLLEAMSYGLSCIASDIPANRNVELERERFFEAGNVTSLAEKMKEFINRPWEAAERKKQIDLINEKYNWGKIAGDTLDVYKKTAR